MSSYTSSSIGSQAERASLTPSVRMWRRGRRVLLELAAEPVHRHMEGVRVLADISVALAYEVRDLRFGDQRSLR